MPTIITFFTFLFLMIFCNLELPMGFLIPIIITLVVHCNITLKDGGIC